MDNLIQQLLDRVNLAELIGQDVQLRKNGPNFVGLCPFHSDSKPSFSVNPQKGLYYCFGCHEGGNALTYLKKARGLAFREAVEEISRTTGMELPADWTREAGQWKEKKEKKELMYEVNDAAALWYSTQLDKPGGQTARDYLEKRKIDKTQASLFGIGYAPVDGGVHRELTRKGLSVASAVEMGLLWQDQVNSSRMGDRFRGRVVFPIRDLSGRIAGFSARALDAATPAKYINSSDSDIFKKGSLLYGLWEARDGIRKQGVVILVEGQIDVISMHKAGFTNTVAPLGTALTETQLRLIKRFTSELVVVFDGDEAGRKAAEKAVRLALSTDIRGKVVILPQGEDPDSLINQTGEEGIRRVMARQTPFLEWMVQTISNRWERTISGKAAAMKEARETSAVLTDDVERNQFMLQIANQLGIEHRDDVVPGLRNPLAARAGRENGGKSPRDALLVQSEKNAVDIIAILLQYPDLLRMVTGHEGILEYFDEAGAALLRAMISQWEETGTVHQATLREEISDGPEVNLLAAVTFSAPEYKAEDASDALARTLDRLIRTPLKKKQTMLIQQLRRAESEADQESSNEILQELELIKERLKRL